MTLQPRRTTWTALAVLLLAVPLLAGPGIAQRSPEAPRPEGRAQTTRHAALEVAPALEKGASGKHTSMHRASLDRALDALLRIKGRLASGSVRPDALEELLVAVVDAATNLGSHVAGSAGAEGPIWVETRLFRALHEASIGFDRQERALLLAALEELTAVARTPEDAARCAALFARLAEPIAGDPDRMGLVRSGAPSLPDAPAADWGGRLRSAVQLVAELRGASAASLVSRLARRAQVLSLNADAPRFIARDTDGNEVDSALFVGQIVVYRFWSHRSPASLAAHAADVALLRKHWNAPVELVGVSRHPNRREHLKRLAGLSLGGTQIYEGPISVELADALARESHLRPAAGTPIMGAGGGAWAAFAEPPPGSLVVVDSHGRVRGRDLSTDELDKLLVQLIAEHRAELRAGRGTMGSSSVGFHRPPE